MEKILYIGGVGSTARQVRAIGRALSVKYDKNVVALSFSEALRQSVAIARLATDCLVITHSAGFVLLKDTTPKRVIAIAPPMPTLPSLLVMRSFPKTIALMGSVSESPDRLRKVIRYHAGALGEHLLRPHRNSWTLRSLSIFNAATMAVELKNAGAQVTLVFMENDRLFPDAANHPHIELAKEYGVKVYENVLGHHDEFVLYPLEVLAQAEG